MLNVKKITERMLAIAFLCAFHVERRRINVSQLEYFHWFDAGSFMCEAYAMILLYGFQAVLLCGLQKIQNTVEGLQTIFQQVRILPLR